MRRMNEALLFWMKDTSHEPQQKSELKTHFNLSFWTQESQLFGYISHVLNPGQPNFLTLVQQITFSDITQRHQGSRSPSHNLRARQCLLVAYVATHHNQMKAPLLFFHLVVALASETSMPLSNIANRDPLYQSTSTRLDPTSIPTLVPTLVQYNIVASWMLVSIGPATCSSPLCAVGTRSGHGQSSVCGYVSN